MKVSEAFLLHKIEYGEADYILSLFTKDFGKISGLAKHAKKKQKAIWGKTRTICASSSEVS
jgi:recombinational DNA repair protein (RecF pathway)